MMSSCINVNVEIWEDLEMVVLFGMGNTIMMHGSLGIFRAWLWKH